MSEADGVIEEINEEIKKAQAEPEEFQIEITDDPQEEVDDIVEEENKRDDPEYGEKVQKRIQKLVAQRREAEVQSRQIQEQNAQLAARLERLEKGSQQSSENAFNQRYAQTKEALKKAIEEGDTDAQLDFSEQIADYRAAMRVSEMQRNQRAQQETASPTVGRAQQAAQNPAPQKAMQWWEKNNWFNGQGYERETAAARAIDVQLDIEGFDKDSDDYYDQLNNRLHNVFPELVSKTSPSKPRIKSRSPVAPSTGGSPNYKGNRVRLTKQQLSAAREVGITTEDGLKRYASEIRKLERS
jgi:hypothetical protein|tara:strand:- start:102 stop:995 length:894 start_codon:yes stop_codon:yes gene_type:complete